MSALVTDCSVPQHCCESEAAVAFLGAVPVEPHVLPDLVSRPTERVAEFL